ncbi:MAG: hypothetical protein QOI34_1688 [Verrucomicrobiota bacterium]|jgi:hypothetical protein
MTIRRSVPPKLSKSYYPTDRSAQIRWHSHFAAEFAKVGPSLGFTETEISNAINDSMYAVYLLETLAAEIASDPSHLAVAVLEGQSQGSYIDLPRGVDSPEAVHPGIDTRRQARVERIKAHPAFTESVGRRLKINSPKLDPKNYRAELGTPRQTGNFVTIPFRKAGGEVSGINLYRKGKNDSAPQLVGFFFRTPAIDTAPGKSGQLTYIARAVVDQKEIGQPSETVTLTLG